MKNIYKFSLILLGIIIICMLSLNLIYTDNIECDEHTIIISVCTDNMRALETGISVYAGYNRVPLILSDKTLPKQLESWLPGYIEENNITKIIVVGPITPQQLYKFMKLKTTVKQVNGDTIPEILTKIAENNKEISKDEIIITASDPLAGVMGAYMKVPVFITATNSTYQSDNTLNENYREYITKNNIKKATIIGNIPENIKTELKNLNLTIEEISGQTSLEVSSNINNKLKKEGYLNNTTKAFYGFYGEIPTIIPTVIKENAILIEDSSNRGNIVPYLKENNITTVYMIRNTESSYIQMEETDYISTDVIENLKKNNITIKYLTMPRTLDEATGLYDMKILTAQYMENTNKTRTQTITNSTYKTQPPLIAILNETKVRDSNNITATITQKNATDYTVDWDTIHPYTYRKIDDNNYLILSDTGYEYAWKKDNSTWHVQYRYNNTDYYHVTWRENNDNTWTEKHEKQEYKWQYDGKKWTCLNNESQIIYYMERY